MKPKKRWRPKVGQRIYGVLIERGAFPTVGSGLWKSPAVNCELLYGYGNCFPTKKLAQEALKRVRRALK